MKPYTHEWWFKIYSQARLLERMAFMNNDEEKEYRYYELARFIENRMNDKYGE